jgi:hypothetical protein
VLVARGECASLQACQREERVLWDGGYGRTLYLNIYGIYGVTRPSVLAEIADSCARVTFETPNAPDVVLGVRPDPRVPPPRRRRDIYRVDITAHP